MTITHVTAAQAYAWVYAGLWTLEQFEMWFAVEVRGSYTDGYDHGYEDSTVDHTSCTLPREMVC